ncbi:hypothetical protein P4S72_26175 [Vibrio sp. PP-XX7]
MSGNRDIPYFLVLLIAPVGACFGDGFIRKLLAPIYLLRDKDAQSQISVMTSQQKKHQFKMH